MCLWGLRWQTLQEFETRIIKMIKALQPSASSLLKEIKEEEARILDYKENRCGTPIGKASLGIGNEIGKSRLSVS